MAGSGGSFTLEEDPEEPEVAIAFDVLEEIRAGEVSVPWGLLGFISEPEPPPKPTRELYLSPDGTPLVWDAPTALLLRSQYRMIPRPIGMGSIRNLPQVKCLPVALMLPEAIVAVERGWLRLAVRQNSLDHASKDAQDASSPHWPGAPQQLVKSGLPTIEMIRGYNDPREQAARTVYKDLWARGLTIGTGNPYGVDFTVYEGDPMAYHSFAAVYVIRGDFRVSSDKVASIVRLQQSVLKLLILAVVSDAPEKTSSTATAQNGHPPDPGRVLVPPVRRPDRAEFVPSQVVQAAPWSKFGPPQSELDGKVIEYVTFSFVSVSRRMD